MTQPSPGSGIVCVLLHLFFDGAEQQASDPSPLLGAPDVDLPDQGQFG